MMSTVRHRTYPQQAITELIQHLGSCGCCRLLDRWHVPFEPKWFRRNGPHGAFFFLGGALWASRVILGCSSPSCGFLGPFLNSLEPLGQR
eukprot:4781579-Pyramimonas_sp.AAC.1